MASHPSCALGRLSIWAQRAIARGPAPRGAPRFLKRLKKKIKKTREKKIKQEYKTKWESEEINRRKKEQNTEQKTEGIKEREIGRLRQTDIQTNTRRQTDRPIERLTRKWSEMDRWNKRNKKGGKKQI